MVESKNQPLPRHSWNYRAPIDDNRQDIPCDFPWTCMECGASDNEMEAIECINCQLLRSIGTRAKRSDSNTTWRLAFRDRDGNENWQPRACSCSNH